MRPGSLLLIAVLLLPAAARAEELEKADVEELKGLKESLPVQKKVPGKGKTKRLSGDGSQEKTPTADSSEKLRIIGGDEERRDEDEPRGDEQPAREERPTQEVEAARRQSLSNVERTEGRSASVGSRLRAVRDFFRDDRSAALDAPAPGASAPNAGPAVGSVGAAAAGGRTLTAARQAAMNGSQQAMLLSRPAGQAAVPVVPRKGLPPAAGKASFINPESPKDLQVAQATGFQPVFQQQGLEVVSSPEGPVVTRRGGGGRASEAEVAALIDAIRRAPVAQTLRPDFFDVVPREHYDELKQDFASNPQLHQTAFKDITTTDGGRDFAWSASCSKLAGDCNKSVPDEKLPYTKGKFVEPEVLEDVWEELDGGKESAADKTAVASAKDAGAQGAGAPENNAAGLEEKLGSLLSRVAAAVGIAGPEQGRPQASAASVLSWSFWRDAPAGSAAPAPAAGRPSGAAGSVPAPGEALAGRDVSVGDLPAHGAAASSRPADHERRQARRAARVWWFVLAAALIVQLARRLRRAEPDVPRTD